MFEVFGLIFAGKKTERNRAFGEVKREKRREG